MVEVMPERRQVVVAMVAKVAVTLEVGAKVAVMADAREMVVAMVVKVAATFEVGASWSAIRWR